MSHTELIAIKIRTYAAGFLSAMGAFAGIVGVIL